MKKRKMMGPNQGSYAHFDCSTMERTISMSGSCCVDAIQSLQSNEYQQPQRELEKLMKGRITQRNDKEKTAREEYGESE